jgi:uncharacterized protein
VPDDPEIPPPEDVVDLTALRLCRSCQNPLAAEALFCAKCGTERNPFGHRRRLRERTDRDQQSWIAVRGALVFYVCYLVTVLPLLWLEKADKPSGMVISSLFDAIVISWYWGKTRVSLLSSLLPNRMAARYAVIGALILIPMLVVNFTYHGWLLQLFGVEEQSLSEIFIAADYGLLAELGIIALLPALFEEVAFRGLLLERFGQVVSRGEAALVTALLFAIIHASLWSAPYLFLLGLVLAQLRIRSGSLLPGMMLHFLHNAAVVLYERRDG